MEPEFPHSWVILPTLSAMCNVSNVGKGVWVGKMEISEKATVKITMLRLRKKYSFRVMRTSNRVP
jgi:hypothetical protein